MEETLKEALLDIRSKLQNRAYTNEEHVRLSLVARILQKLGWNIWNPNQVNAEFATLPDENRKKVDIALFIRPRLPSVFIEVKAVGKIDNNLREIERQLRDYNTNMSSDFCIITDGCVWKFYYSLTPGEFRDKCFKTLDLWKDDIDETQSTLQMFLSKSSIESGESKLKAEGFLKLTLIEKAMERCLPDARRKAQEDPLISLAAALVQSVEKEGYSVSQEEAAKFIQKIGSGSGSGSRTVVQPPPPPPPPGEGIKLDPHKPDDLRHTKNVEGQVGEMTFRKWKGLVHAVVKKACGSGMLLPKLRTYLRVVEGSKTNEGFTPIPELSISVGGYSANDSWNIAFKIAESLNLPIKVQFYWLEKEGAAYPGKKGMLQWSP